VSAVGCAHGSNVSYFNPAGEIHFGTAQGLSTAETFVHEGGHA
jgi:hypothetical protein